MKVCVMWFKAEWRRAALSCKVWSASQAHGGMGLA